MTVTEAPVVEVEAPAPAPAPAPSRRKALSMLMDEIKEFEDLMILARRLTLGTDKVQSEGLCKSGTEEFMVRGHLVPTTSKNPNRHPRQEPESDALAAEAKIRTWVRKKIDGALEDYTTIGLMKKIPVIRKAREEWQQDFRKLIIGKHRDGYITLERLNEVFPKLKLEPYQEMVRVSWSVSFDYKLPAGSAPDTRDPAWEERERARLAEALRQFAGPDARLGWAERLNRYISVVMTRFVEE
jgi:hypothetical protein